MAAVPRAVLGEEALFCEKERQDILSCIDFHITGF
jgi:hypothetical protein